MASSNCFPGERRLTALSDSEHKPKRLAGKDSSSSRRSASGSTSDHSSRTSERSSRRSSTSGAGSSSGRSSSGSASNHSRRTSERSSRRSGAAEAKRGISAFYICYIILAVLLILLILFVFLYVRSSLVTYEKNQPDNFMEDLVQSLSKDENERIKVENLCYPAGSSSPYENAEEMKTQLNQTLQSADLSYELDSNSYDSNAPVYRILADGEDILHVQLYTTKSENRMGILTIAYLDVEDIVPAQGGETGSLQDDGTYKCTVHAPSTYTVLLNGVELPNDLQTGEAEILDEFQNFAQYTDLPEMVTYEVSGLSYPPVVTALNEQGENAEFTADDGTVDISYTYTTGEAAEELGSQVDALYITETWSKLMTDDLDGENHGIAQVRAYLIPDSYLDNMAYDFANSVDIQFVSVHTLDEFANESVSNYIMYSPNCFSCDVYFEKIMSVYENADRTDVFNSRVYFVNVTDAAVATPGWYMVDMQTIIE